MQTHDRLFIDGEWLAPALEGLAAYLEPKSINLPMGYTPRLQS